MEEQINISTLHAILRLDGQMWESWRDRGLSDRLTKEPLAIAVSLYL